jgi:hypothetical protein
MILARMPSAMFEHFALNGEGVIQMALLERDFAESAKQIDSYGMIVPESRGYEIESLVR